MKTKIWCGQLWYLMMKIRLFVSVHFFGTWDYLSLETVLLFCTISVRKIAVYRIHFHRTRTKRVLKFWILLITESSVLRKGSFPIIGQHFYHFFSFEKLFSHKTHNKIIFKVTWFFSFSFFMNSLLCFFTALFAFTSPLFLFFFLHF